MQVDQNAQLLWEYLRLNQTLRNSDAVPNDEWAAYEWLVATAAKKKDQSKRLVFFLAELAQFDRQSRFIFERSARIYAEPDFAFR